MSILDDMLRDPHLHFAHDGGPLRRVTLDGEEITGVVACRCSSNEMQGWAEVTERDEQGRIFIRGDEVATRIVEGDVRVEVVA